LAVRTERQSAPFLSGLSRRQTVISLTALVVVVALGWYLALRQLADVDAGGGEMAGTMGMALGPFLLMWLPMVVAMMFPTVGPSAVTAERGGAGRAAAFLLAYLVVWMLFGLAVYLLLAAAERIVSIPADNAKWLAVAIFALAGLYQFAPVKDRCLGVCRSAGPDFGDGSDYPAVARAGARYGLSCLGCCVGYMVVLIAIGMTSIAAMAILTVVIFVERYVLPRSAMVPRVVGALLLLAAVLTPFVSWLHPGLPGGEMGSGDTPMT